MNISDPNRFSEASKFLTELINRVNNIKIPIAIVATNCDVDNNEAKNLFTEQFSSFENVEEFKKDVKKCPLKIFYSSLGNNVEYSPLEWLNRFL